MLKKFLKNGNMKKNKKTEGNPSLLPAIAGGLRYQSLTFFLVSFFSLFLSHFFNFQSSEQTPQPENTIFLCENFDFWASVFWENGPFEGDSIVMFFTSFLSFFQFLPKRKIVSSFLFQKISLPASVSESNYRCSLRSWCSMQMWCPDDTGRDSWCCASATIVRSRVCTNEPHHTRNADAHG